MSWQGVKPEQVETMAWGWGRSENQGEKHKGRKRGMGGESLPCLQGASHPQGSEGTRPGVEGSGPGEKGTGCASLWYMALCPVLPAS